MATNSGVVPFSFGPVIPLTLGSWPMHSHRLDADGIEALAVGDITPRVLTWLWLHRLAHGKLALLDGDPNLGKSLVTLDLCARLSTGRPFPDGTPARADGPVNSLVINGEDGDNDTIVPRLAALGADMRRVFVLHRTAGLGGLPLRLPHQLHALDRAIARTGARLVVIDPIMAFFDAGVQIASDASVRQALLPLAELAARHDCVMLLVRHLNKSNGHRATYRGGGSIGFLAMCRSAWLIAKHPRLPKSQRVLAEIKNNLCAAQPSLVYEVVAEAGRLPTLRWHDSCCWTADQLLAAAARAVVPAKVELAIDFLKSFLKDGPRLVPDIWAAAGEEHLRKATLQRAKKLLKISSHKVYIDRRQCNYWLLPHQELPAGAVPVVAEDNSLEHWLAPLREQFPPATPLDDV
jgi:RecA-family ATPase